MSASPDNGDLDKRIELLKKDFEILQANINSALTEMRADLAKQGATLSKRAMKASGSIFIAILTGVCIASGVFSLIF